MIEKDPKVPQPEKETFMTAAVAEFVKFEQELIEKSLKTGIEKGIGKGVGKSILKVLTARGLAVSEEVRQRVLCCADAELLDRWITRAALVSAAEDLFA